MYLRWDRLTFHENEAMKLASQQLRFLASREVSEPNDNMAEGEDHEIYPNFGGTLVDFFNHGDCEIEITDSKRNEDGVMLFKMRCSKYFWTLESELTDHTHLISDYWEKGNTLSDINVSRKRKASDFTQEVDYSNLEGGDEGPEEEDYSGLTAEEVALLQYTSVVDSDDDDGDDDADDDYIPGDGDDRAVENDNDMADEIDSNTTSGLIQLTDLTDIIECGHCNEKFTQIQTFKDHFKSSHENVDYKFHCALCQKEYHRFKHLKDHVLTHTTARPYVCAFCDKKYRTKYSLKEHLQKIHNIWKCRLCEYTVDSKEILEKHYTEKHDGKRFQCTKCEALCEHYSDWAEHVKSCTVRTRHQCDLCEKSFWNKSSFNMHRRIHDGTNPHKCTDCGKYFLKRSKLLEHRRVHTKKYSRSKKAKIELSCEVCSKKFIDKRCFNMHMKMHDGSCPFHCKECDKFFGSKTKLEHHYRSKHSNEMPFQCGVCEKKFKFERYLKEHLKWHEAEVAIDSNRKYRCNTCNEFFERICELKKHLEYSIKCSSLDCHICKQKFQTRKRLNCHMKIHKIEGTAHECDQCNKRFRHKSDLTRHMRTHSVDLQFACDQCDKKFIENWELKAHVEWHATGRHPFQCPECDKILGKHSKLQAHIRQVHRKERDYTCDTCGKEFSARSDLKKHELTHDSEFEAGKHMCMICNAEGFTKQGLEEHQIIHLRVETSNTMLLDFNQVQSFDADYLLEHDDDEEEQLHNQTTIQLPVHLNVEPTKPINVPSLLNSNLDTQEILAKMENIQETIIEEAPIEGSITIQRVDDNIEVTEQNIETSNGPMEQILKQVALAITMAGESGVTTVPIQVIDNSGVTTVEEESVYPRRFVEDQGNQATVAAAMQNEEVETTEITYSQLQQVISSVPSNQAHLFHSVQQLLIAARERDGQDSQEHTE